MPRSDFRPYRARLYRKYRDVCLDGRYHLIYLDLRPDSDHEASQRRLTELFTQLVDAEGGNRWAKEDSQLLLADHPDERESFWWTPDREERR